MSESIEQNGPSFQERFEQAIAQVRATRNAKLFENIQAVETDTDQIGIFPVTIGKATHYILKIHRDTSIQNMRLALDHFLVTKLAEQGRVDEWDEDGVILDQRTSENRHQLRKALGKHNDQEAQDKRNEINQLEHVKKLRDASIGQLREVLERNYPKTGPKKRSKKK